MEGPKNIYAGEHKTLLIYYYSKVHWEIKNWQKLQQTVPSLNNHKNEQAG